MKNIMLQKNEIIKTQIYGTDINQKGAFLRRI